MFSSRSSHPGDEVSFPSSTSCIAQHKSPRASMPAPHATLIPADPCVNPFASSPRCGHCKKFEPVYRKAASHLRLWGSDAILAKVDGPANPNLSREMGVAGFPSLHWFAYGEERAYEGGRRNDSLVEWVSHHSRYRDTVRPPPPLLLHLLHEVQ
jgi:hypothetical protein